MRLAVIQHSPWEGTCRYLRQAAREWGGALSLLRVWEGRFPDPQAFAGFIFLGGGAGLHEEGHYPLLQAEKEYLQRHVLMTDKPCLGICLGHRLLAEAFGAQVGPNFCLSLGGAESLLTKAGRDHPLYQGVSPRFPTFKRHTRAVIPPLPNHFEILATSKECQVESFTIATRPYIIGMQFANHAAHVDDVSHWYAREKIWLKSLVPPPVGMEELLEKIGRVTTRFFGISPKFLLILRDFVTDEECCAQVSEDH